LDDLIRKAMEGIGAKWISMAYDHTTKTRDFHFDWKKYNNEPKEGGNAK